jgi:CheY-like chemotaxis protein
VEYLPAIKTPTIEVSFFPTTDQTMVQTPIPPTIPKPHCLITDDNPINRRLLVTFLRKQDFTYSEAVNGQVAVELYCASPPKFKFILMGMPSKILVHNSNNVLTSTIDVSMPVMDGITATRKILKYEKTNRLKKVAHRLDLQFRRT